jgi:hypothetical protein
LEMVEIGDSIGDRGCEVAVEATGPFGLWLPCPRGREPSERAETWRRRGDRESAEGYRAGGEGPSVAEALAAAGREEAAAAEASAAAGWEEASAAEAAQASAAAGEAAPVAGAAPPSGSDDFPSGGNTPIERAATGHCRG